MNEGHPGRDLQMPVSLPFPNGNAAPSSFLGSDKSTYAPVDARAPEGALSGVCFPQEQRPADLQQVLAAVAAAHLRLQPAVHACGNPRWDTTLDTGPPQYGRPQTLPAQHGLASTGPPAPRQRWSTRCRVLLSP